MIRTLISHIEEVLCGVFLSVMVVLVILNVFLRYLFGYSLFWAEEVATLCFVWCVFIGAAATYKHKMDIGIEMLVNKLPNNANSVARVLVKSALLLINATLFYFALQFTVIAWEKPTAVLGVTSAVFNASLIVGFGLITLHTIRFLIEDLKSLYKSSITS